MGFIKNKKEQLGLKLSNELANTLNKPLQEIQASTNTNLNELKNILESFHAHLEMIVEINAKMLDIMEKQTKIIGVFNEEKYYKNTGYEEANSKKITK